MFVGVLLANLDNASNSGLLTDCVPDSTNNAGARYRTMNCLICMQLCWLVIDTETEQNEAAAADERCVVLAHCTLLGFFACAYAVATLLLDCHAALLLCSGFMPVPSSRLGNG